MTTLSISFHSIILDFTIVCIYVIPLWVFSHSIFLVIFIDFFQKDAKFHSRHWQLWIYSCSCHWNQEVEKIEHINANDNLHISRFGFCSPFWGVVLISYLANNFSKYPKTQFIPYRSLLFFFFVRSSKTKSQHHRIYINSGGILFVWIFHFFCTIILYYVLLFCIRN